MPYRFCRVPLTAEMHPLKREIGCYDDIFVGSGPQDGAVVANAHAKLAPRRTRARLNRRDKAQFRMTRLAGALHHQVQAYRATSLPSARHAATTQCLPPAAC